MRTSYWCLHGGDGIGVLGLCDSEVGWKETLRFMVVISEILRGQKT